MSNNELLAELVITQVEAAEERHQQRARDEQDIEEQFAAEKSILQKTILQTQIQSIRYTMGRAAEEVARIQSKLKKKLPVTVQRGLQTLVALRTRTMNDLRRKLNSLLSRYDVTQVPLAPRRSDRPTIISDSGDD